MRDTRKPASYFEAYIKYEQGRIARRVKKLSGCDNEEKELRINENLLLNCINLLIASFSYGTSLEELRVLHQQSCDTACKIRALTYSDALTLTAFAVMLENGVAMPPLFEKFNELFAGDKLLTGLRTYLETGKAEWRGGYSFRSPYAGLDAIINAVDTATKEQALLAYLNNWYTQCKDCAWYNTEANPNDVYYGYWSFESAAIAKIFNLNIAICSKSPYFPAL